jgi:hypothetical protein
MFIIPQSMMTQWMLQRPLSSCSKNICMQQVDKGFWCIEAVSLCFIHHFCIYSSLCISTVIWLCFCCFFLGTKFSVTIFLWRKCYIETGASVVLFCFSEKAVICDIRGCQLPIVFNICSCWWQCDIILCEVSWLNRWANVSQYTSSTTASIQETGFLFLFFLIYIFIYIYLKWFIHVGVWSL